MYIKRKISGESNFVVAFWKSWRDRVKSFVWMFIFKLKIKVVVESYRNYSDYFDLQGVPEHLKGLGQKRRRKRKIMHAESRFNPSTVKIMPWKMQLQTERYILWSYNTSIFDAMHFDENPFHMTVWKSKQKGFQISHFYWSFSSDDMAVKGLNISDCTNVF